MITSKDLVSAFADRLYQWSEQVRHVFRRTSPEHYSRGELAPVVLLPGVYETWQFLRPVGNRLNALGHPIHIIAKLGYNRKTVTASAALAQRYLDDLNLTGVILVAHSKGGLIGKHMMVTDDLTARVAQLIAVNTPFGGSTLARYALGATMRAFSPADETLTSLGANLTANRRITSIYSRLDPLIPAGSELAGATNVELSMVGHFRPLASRQLFATIEHALHTSQGRE